MNYNQDNNSISRDLTGRVAVVTGGCGHLGGHICQRLAALGCRVFAIDRHENDQFDTSRIKFVQADLEDDNSRKFASSFIQDQVEKIDILINNAAFVGDSDLKGWGTRFEEQSIDTWRRAMEVNLTTPFHLSQLFIDALRKSGSGCIINVSSIYGLVGPDMSLYRGTAMGNPAAYAASKGGLIQLSRWLATTLAPNIRVNAVSLGGLERGQNEAFKKRYIARTPMSRMGNESDVLGAIVYLASDESLWVTGQNIVVDGGWTSW